MYFLSESVCKEIVTQREINEIVEQAFAAIAAGDAVNFPVVREQLYQADAIFGLKSGYFTTDHILGVKAGGYWASNDKCGLPNHISSVILFDDATGIPTALISATTLTSMRTAAACAISIKYLSRPDSCTLGVLGAGGQAETLINAAQKERRFKSLYIADIDSGRALALRERFSSAFCNVELCDAESMTRSSDVIITITPSQRPIIKSDWVKNGTHIAAIGADTVGKQELDIELLERGNVFCDVVSQAITIGECQHSYREGRLAENEIKPIGEVIINTAFGRNNPNSVTIFDSTGVAMQDLTACNLALRKAIKLNRGVKIPYSS